MPIILCKLFFGHLTKEGELPFTFPTGVDLHANSIFNDMG
jgi:hypothetical protein